MTPCQFIKKYGIVDNFGGKNLELSKCQVPLSHGDNAFTGFYMVPLCPTGVYYRSVIPPDAIVRTNFIPLTVARGPLFYMVLNPRE
jgi:hypothetical protein